MRIRIRLAISGLVLASIIVSAVGVHVLWWRTAEANSQTLAATINEQIVAAVGKELDTITTQARAAHTAIRTLFVQNVLETREADKREFVFLSQLQSQPGISWVAFGWPDGDVLRRAQARRSGPGDDGDRAGRRRGQAARRRISGGRRRHPVREAPVRRHRLRRHRSGMVQEGHASDEPSWFEVTAHPVGLRPSIALCRPDRRLPETPGRSRRHHRKHAARAVPVAALGRKDRRGVHPRPRRQRRSPRRIRTPTRLNMQRRISRCCRSRRARSRRPAAPTTATRRPRARCGWSPPATPMRSP